MPFPCSLLILTKNETSRPHLEMILDIYTKFEYFTEILALDASTDETEKLLRRYGVKVYREVGEQTFASRRNFLQDHASCDWVLHCDADELFDLNLLDNIHGYIDNEQPTDRLPNVVAFKFPRLNQHHVYPDYQIRLLNRQYCVWGPPEPHERVLLKRTMHPVDEVQHIGELTVKFCQTLDKHRIVHLPRDSAYDAQVQDRWKELVTK